MEVYKIRKRPRNDPLSWIRQGEYVEGDELNSPQIQGVTNRPLKQLLENDLDLLIYLENSLSLVQDLEGRSLESPWHLDMGSGLFHMDVNFDPGRKTYFSLSNIHQDHNDIAEFGQHLDHNDHLDIPEVNRNEHTDIDHEDQTINVPHADYTDHADSHEDHSDTINRPHGDVAHSDHSDHQDYYSQANHNDHLDYYDHNDAHVDFYNPLPSGHIDSHADSHTDTYSHIDCANQVYNDFAPQLTGYSCAVLPQALRTRQVFSCQPSGAHYDYSDHIDHPADGYAHVDGHFLFMVIGWQHQDQCGSFQHIDGHREWFYQDYDIHYDYPNNFQDHLDSFAPNHTDHGDTWTNSYANHWDHGDYHTDHSDHLDLTSSATQYVNHSDHIDTSHTDYPHVNHTDHYDQHQDIPLSHQDRSATTIHQDVREVKHTDHRDVAHGDETVPHQDYTPDPNTSSYHLDIQEQHFDAAHGDRGSYRQEDVSRGLYEVIYEGVWHGDRVWHADEDTHGDVEQGSPVHSDHTDINAHGDTPHGDSPHQDTLSELHQDQLSGPYHSDHSDHVDGTPPFQIHLDNLTIRDERTHQDHVDWTHLDYHLDFPHVDEDIHQDTSSPSVAHIDYLHQDHLDHSDWDHDDHSDLGGDFRFRQFLTYSDHGDYVLHKDVAHQDAMNHNDYYPEHTDHFDHGDQPHGDEAEQYFHEDETIPPSHLDISVPHDDIHSDHGDQGSNSHADFHADHTDHGDYTASGRHGDFTYNTPHLDFQHIDASLTEDHFDGPLGTAHNDIYYHLDYPHIDETTHSDYTTQ